MHVTRFSHILFFCLIFVGMATVSPVIHNDDGRHLVHPLAHSAVCKWVKEGKLCRATPVSSDPVPFVLSLVVLLFFSLPLKTARYPLLFSFKDQYTRTCCSVRAPPFQI